MIVTGLVKECLFGVHNVSVKNTTELKSMNGNSSLSPLAFIMAQVTPPPIAEEASARSAETRGPRLGMYAIHDDANSLNDEDSASRTDLTETETSPPGGVSL